MKLPQTRRADRGAAAVEFALVLPLLLLIIFGIIDFGRAYNAQASLNSGVREGARVLALTGDAGQACAAASLTSGCGTTPCPTPDTAIDTFASLSGSQPFAYVTPVSGLMRLFGLGGLADLTLTATATFRCN